jgi:mono/diheme cytochrome c family protein
MSWLGCRLYNLRDWLSFWMPFVVVGLAASSGRTADDGETNEGNAPARAFLQQHCQRCHGPETSENDFRVDSLKLDFSRKEFAVRWAQVLRRIQKREMPPPGEPQPTDRERTAFGAWLTRQLELAAPSRGEAPQAVLRRLNRREYANTIRDLLGIEYQPPEDFPDDPPAYGFDNIGSALTVSPVHIEKYMAAAREIVNQAIATGPRPYSRRWRFEVDQAAVKSEVLLSRPDVRGEEHVYALMFGGAGSEVQDGNIVLHHSAWDRIVGVRAFRVHRTGRYVVRVRASGRVPRRSEVIAAGMRLHDQHLESDIGKTESPQQKEKMRFNWNDGQRDQIRRHFENDVAYDYGPPRLRVVLNETTVLAVVDVTNRFPDNKTFEFPVVLKDTDLEIKVSNAYSVPELPENFWLLTKNEFPRPELMIDWIEVEGPLYDQWPPASHQRLFEGISQPDEKARARAVLSRFMTRAFRRPVDGAEVESLVRLFVTARSESRTFEEAIKVPLVAILTSPSFLYLAPADAVNSTQPSSLAPFELASRLSYFLWSSMPDDELFAMAASGKLMEAEVLQGQVSRLLADDRAKSFVASFSRQWLGLRDIGTVRPDERLFPRFDEHLLESMVNESQSFFGHVLYNDLSVLNFLKSDFAMLNERLARFYRIPGVQGDYFRPVPLGTKHPRGGVLTQASMLMMTSNGTRTSPVKRGQWVLENLLADPPDQPPPNVGEIQPSVPGIDKATVRVRLEAHRKLPECAGCHQKIDPLGFALENYNAIGEWREKEGFGWLGRAEENDPPIDASGILPDGRKFRGLAEMQNILLTDDGYKRKFLRCLAEKIAIYAWGRGITDSDRETIDGFVDRLEQHENLRELIKDVVVSQQFISK